MHAALAISPSFFYRRPPFFLDFWSSGLIWSHRKFWNHRIIILIVEVDSPKRLSSLFLVSEENCFSWGNILSTHEILFHQFPVNRSIYTIQTNVNYRIIIQNVHIVVIPREMIPTEITSICPSDAISLPLPKLFDLAGNSDRKTTNLKSILFWKSYKVV